MAGVDKLLINENFRVRNLTREYERLEEMYEGGRYRHTEVDIRQQQYLISECIGLHQHVNRLEEMIHGYARTSLANTTMLVEKFGRVSDPDKAVIDELTSSG